MIIENRKRVIKFKLWNRFIAFLMVASIAVAIIPVIPDILIINIKKIHLAITICSFYLIQVIYRYNLDYNYIYFSDDNDKIVFRYYSLRPFNDLKSSIEIPKKELAKFEIKKFFFRQKEKITLFQKTKNGIAKYPQISISSFKKNEIIILKRLLTAHSSQ